MPTNFADDLGRYQLGYEIPLVLQCLTAAGAPDLPTVHPTAEVRADTGSTWTHFGKIPADDQGFRTGFFRGPLMLDSRFRAGRYTIFYRWVDSASRNRVQIQEVEVIDGSSADGSIIAMHGLDRPDSRTLIMQTDAGLLKKGVNPR